MAQEEGTEEGTLTLSDLKIGQFVDTESRSYAIRCPHCGKNGTFDRFRPAGWSQTVGKYAHSFSAGARACPNPECRGLVLFVAHESAGEIIATFPPETLDFDATGLPLAVKAALEESIRCHAAECYRAAALMVRRTLEEVCLDRGAEGNNLQKRIAALGTKIVLPQELLQALDQLRLLGNDAAHIEARVYEQIGREEVEIGVMLAKEILKAAYQYGDLVSRLRGLGKQGA